ncbi:hypothetical protein BYT27DRAFT_7261886 [Phlegmacium glaucopus]|nr:hypothetical protein BYT27DRAFT_7261886 [Phlegmacium glaucopus]
MGMTTGGRKGDPTNGQVILKRYLIVFLCSRLEILTIEVWPIEMLSRPSSSLSIVFIYVIPTGMIQVITSQAPASRPKVNLSPSILFSYLISEIIFSVITELIIGRPIAIVMFKTRTQNVALIFMPSTKFS